MSKLEIVIIISWIANIVFNLAKHGEEKEGKYNVFTVVISVIISYFIYKWCGLF